MAASRATRKQAKEVSDTRESEKLRRRIGDLEAKTERQQDYIDAIGRSDQVFALGPAGTGKTFIPASIAADMLGDGLIDRIVLCRPAVDVEEKHGYIPGEIEDKTAPWARPVVDIIRGRLGAAHYAKLVQAGRIEVLPFSYIRGLTLDRCFVILDEAQNTTPRQMKAFLTRIGEGTKIVIEGDVTQKDIKGPSGLEEALFRAHRHSIPVEIVSFSRADIVRSGICRMWVDAFDEVDDA